MVLGQNLSDFVGYSVGIETDTPPTVGYVGILDFVLYAVGTSVVTPPVPQTPVVEVIEARRWPGPPIVIYRETDIIPAWQRRREDEEIVIL